MSTFYSHFFVVAPFVSGGQHPIVKATVLAKEAHDILRVQDAFTPLLCADPADYNGTNPEVLGTYGITTHGCYLPKLAPKKDQNW